MKSQITIDGVTYDVLDRNLANSPYCVYQNKIWRIVGELGNGIHHRKNLSRPLNNENIWIHFDQIEELKYLTVTYHIPI